MNGAATIVGKLDRLRSAVCKSELIKLMNFPELVYVILFIESMTALSNKLIVSV